jgi:hypothetical protein
MGLMVRNPLYCQLRKLKKIQEKKKTGFGVGTFHVLKVNGIISN